MIEMTKYVNIVCDTIGLKRAVWIYTLKKGGCLFEKSYGLVVSKHNSKNGEYMRKGQKITIVLMTLALMLSGFTLFNEPTYALESGETIEYLVKEDAYIRRSKPTQNYNFENITKAHGSQYEGLNYRVINSKYWTNDEIIGLMKFDLPTVEEIETNNLDKFEFEFNLFRNSDFNNGAQDYEFHYTTDTSWDEETLTWDNRPETITRDNTDILFTFHINKGDTYEFKTEEEKRIVHDVTDVIEQLVADGETEITVFATAKETVNTSILIHSKESEADNKQARIIGSTEGINLQSLKELVESYADLDAEDYTEESYTLFATELQGAQVLIDSESEDLTAIRQAYRLVQSAFNSLVKTADPNDPDNVAYMKPTRSNLSNDQTYLVTDGNIDTSWSGVFYPAYVDVDLMDTYDLESIKVYTPVGKKTYFTVYGSNDGKNYDRIYQRREAIEGTSDGESIVFDEIQSYRIIRIYMEYTQGENRSYISEFKAYGQRTNTNREEIRTGSLAEILEVDSFDNTNYSTMITEAETIENVYGIIDRTVGAEYRDWFSFELVEGNDETDFFELSDLNGKVHIKGNSGLSLTTGLNYYYKNYVNVNISEQTMQVNMPNNIVKIGTTVHKETSFKVRYAFNYCTLSYTFAFFGEEEWQRENDWLALNGVSVVLDLAGQEATWIQFLMNFGYSFDEAKDWLTGPAYYAWQFMDNMEVFGGPIPDGYVKDRIELARSTQRWKRSLGMQTVMQGYAGMVPINFNEFQPDVSLVAQGGWGGFTRPSMIATDSDLYDEYARKFYEAQEFVYGNTSDYYAVDPFHEGGKRPQGLTDDIIAKEVLESLLEYDENGIWIVQGWQSNPTNDLLKGMGDYRNDHVLIVDLVKYPLKSWTKYNSLSYGSTRLDSVEFNGTDWAWTLLGNFGGNPTMNGQMEIMVEDILNAKKTSSHMQGLGIISEGTNDNPILYDLIFDLAWVDGDDFNLNQWMNKYIERRYGGVSENVRLAWQIMKDSNYNQGVRHTSELYGMKNKGPHDYGTQNISYGADKLETAFKLLAADFDKYSDNETYIYDLREVMRQVVSNYSITTYNNVLKAQNNNDYETFVEEKEKFLTSFEVLNAVQGIDKDQLAGEWIGKATDRAESYDDFSKDTFEMNAKTLITTWGSRNSGSLKEYGWRNYEGMFLDIYTDIWSEYLDKVELNLLDGSPITTIGAREYFDRTWHWVMGDQDYTREPNNSPAAVQEIINMVIDNCSLTDGLDPNAGNIALSKVVEVDSKQTSGRPHVVVDGDTDTYLTIKQSDMKNPEVIVNLIAEFQLTKVNIVLDNTGGVFYHYKVYTSIDGITWTEIAYKDSDEVNPVDGDVIEIEATLGRYIKVEGVKDSNHLQRSAGTELVVKEIRAYGERMLPDLGQLESMIDVIENLKLDTNSQEKINQLNVLVGEAKEALDRLAPPDELEYIYWNLYDYVSSLDLSGYVNIALNKPVSAHNDPSGNSKNIVDGDLGTHWNSGRLSPTGQPYQHEPIVEGWSIIDLEDEYVIDEIRVHLTNATIWHHYEVYGSLDGTDWFLLGDKTTDTLPDIKENTFYLENKVARYLKLVTTDIQIGSDGKRISYGVSEFEAFGTLYVEADTTELVTMINEAKAIDTDTLTEYSKNVLETAIASAEALLQNTVLQQEIVDQESGTLRSILDTLDVALNITEATDLLDSISSLDEATFTEETWTKLIEEQIKLDNLLESYDPTQVLTLTQNEIDESVTALNNAKNALELKPVIDYSKLEGAIAKAQALTNLTSYSEGVLAQSLQTAQEVLTSAATQAQVDTATQTLETVIATLEQIIDMNEANRIIEEISKLDVSKYTVTTWNALQQAKEKLEGLLNAYDPTKALAFTQKDMDDAILTVNNAMDALELIDVIPDIDNKDLETLIKEAQEIDTKGYTQKSIDALNNAITKAKEALESENQNQIDSALEKLKEAIKNLEKIKETDKEPNPNPNPEKPTDNLPGTGVDTNTGMWLIIGLGGLILEFDRRRRSKNK